MLEGGAGADDLNGGGGSDTASYAGSSSLVRVNLAVGTGTAGDAQGDTLTGIENLTGSSFGDLLEGDDGVNILRGGGGDDVFRSGGGADVLNGGSGTDTANYAVSTAVFVSLFENIGSGGDAEGDTFISIENLHGSGENDTLIGDNGPNSINGNGGDDTIVGAGGADTLTGFSGQDTFIYTARTETGVGAGFATSSPTSCKPRATKSTCRGSMPWMRGPEPRTFSSLAWPRLAESARNSVSFSIPAIRSLQERSGTTATTSLTSRSSSPA